MSRKLYRAAPYSRSIRPSGIRAAQAFATRTRRWRASARSSGIEKIDPPGLGTKDRAGRLDRRKDGRGLRRRSQLVNSVVADPDEAHIAPAVVTLDKAAVAVAGRHINRAGVCVCRGGCADQGACGKADADSGAPVRMSLGAA